ncbi:forkhead box protein D4 [Biomphalaria pfeifferi]|uniref:Forkhead box protein D4 n=1 Tax=Biomphalaria pfeifferi TaxID=112525 RepID=A0AAD8FDV5_BIOPF|nr:forkhead box protein D4 [Biomphalaria pfeifferi]
MCAPSQGVLLPYGLKIPSPYFPFGPGGSLSHVHLSALDFQRSQLNDYNVRVQLGLRNYQNTMGLSPFQAYINDPYTQAYFYKHDPRARFVHEEPKPSHSYIGLIGMAILNSKEKKLVLSDIYQWILDNYPYFRTRGPGWRNSIRHNLSLNDCFIKAGRSANGKGHYWAVHPANVDDFERGDFRRRRAQRKVRRHMGLSVPDDDDSPTPSPTQPWPHHDMAPEHDRGHLDTSMTLGDHTMRAFPTDPASEHLIISHHASSYGPLPLHPRKPSKKRLFDVASLLAPDDDDEVVTPNTHMTYSDPLKGAFISGYSLPQMSDDLKSDRRPSSGHSKDSSGTSTLNDNGREVTSRSSCSGKGDLSYESDDDIDDNEIHVTSGENSPAHEMDDDCDMDHSGNSDFLSRDMKHFRGQDSKNFEPISHNLTNGAKLDRALDLTSAVSTALSTDVKDVAPDKSEASQNVMSKQPTQTRQDEVKTNYDNFLISNALSDAGFKMENKLSVDTSLSRSNTSNVDIKLPFDSKSNMDNDKHQSSPVSVSNDISDKGSDGHGHVREERHGNADLKEASTHTPESVQYFHAEMQELRRQRHFEIANGLVDSNRNQLDVRRATPEVTSPISDPTRLSSAETIRWSDLGKAAIPRDRASAFSTLGIRGHPLYTPFQMRNFAMPHHRLLPMALPVRTGNPVLVGPTVSPSMQLLKGLEAYTNGTIPTNSNTNMSSRTTIRE